MLKVIFLKIKSFLEVKVQCLEYVNILKKDNFMITKLNQNLKKYNF